MTEAGAECARCGRMTDDPVGVEVERPSLDSPGEWAALCPACHDELTDLAEEAAERRAEARAERRADGEDW